MRTIGLETFLPCTTLFSVFLDMKYSNANERSNFRLNYVKVLCLKSIFLLLTVSCTQAQSDPEVQSDRYFDVLPITGAQNLPDYLPLLKDKKVAVVGNQTSLVVGVHLVDTLVSSGVKLVRVFSPEHGFRGDADAGEHVKNEVDKKTGLPIISLYGNNKKPTKSQMAGIDVLVFDIQDVGVRFYTYISTLHYVMEACAENQVKLIVLDRPNPNGYYVDGPILDTNFRSFVGMHPVPIVHGMTIGEYAQMINGEGWLNGRETCDLTVIACRYYHHNFQWHLDVPPSPNLRSDISISLYPSLCLLEATDVTVGRGTEGPFERYGHPDFPDSLAFSFTPKPDAGDKSPKHQGELCYGYNLNSLANFRKGLDLSYLLNAYELMNGDLFKGKSKRMFFLLCGTDSILKQMQAGLNEEQIKASWQADLDAFKIRREKYLLYP